MHYNVGIVTDCEPTLSSLSRHVCGPTGTQRHHLRSPLGTSSFLHENPAAALYSNLTAHTILYDTWQVEMIPRRLQGTRAGYSGEPPTLLCCTSQLEATTGSSDMRLLCLEGVPARTLRGRNIGAVDTQDYARGVFKSCENCPGLAAGGPRFLSI